MSARKLLAMLAALAMLFAPSVAYAAAPMTPDRGMQAMEMGHCVMLPSKTGDHNKIDGRSCCNSMCVAVAIALSTPAGAGEARPHAVYFTVPAFWHGFRGEIATPPPRMA